MLLIALFLAWWLLCLHRLLSGPASPFAWAGWIAIGVILTHSGWDYPLRTTALSTVFALSCILTSRIISEARQRQKAGFEFRVSVMIKREIAASIDLL